MLEFGYKALKALPKFFSYRNDIDIYTEDKVADKEFYRTLFKRVLGNEIKINDVTPLGCKTNVLNAFDNQDKTDRRKKLYIVDGDLELILDTNRKATGNLIVLDSYCIENYLIDETGGIELIYFSNGSESRDNLKNKLNFSKWLEYNAPYLVDLFLNFAILRKYGGGPIIKTAHDFLTQNGKQTILDKDSINQYSQDIKSQIIQRLTINSIENPDETYSNDYTLLSNKWKTNNMTLLRIVSAKNYLIPLLQFRINFCIDKGKSLVPKDSFKLFLADKCDIQRLSFIREKV
ncbi:MAG: hypothetical protein CMD31_12545 [Flavobacteriales bacterium]|nr:hypothetical protein [Flavobacteriales bacterium]|tara:strand:+ start:33091 stop:33960 length:870 start_codon:yes stop_codon:yes gene_type:complete